MEVVSLAWRADLALLASSGSIVEHHATHVLVRTPTNPGFRWGNFMLLHRRPTSLELPMLRARFRACFPDLAHETYGVDDPHGRLSDLSAFTRSGFETSASIVLTAETMTAAVRTAPVRQVPVGLRMLESDQDWEQRVELALAVHPGVDPAYAEFVARRARTERARTRHGGAWFGAFEGAELVGGLGIYQVGPGLARYQEVETHPRMRRRGIASALLHAGAEYAGDVLGATTLVIVADPDYHALGLYRRLGFVDTEVQLQADLARRT